MVDYGLSEDDFVATLQGWTIKADSITIAAEKAELVTATMEENQAMITKNQDFLGQETSAGLGNTYRQLYDANRAIVEEDGISALPDSIQADYLKAQEAVEGLIAAKKNLIAQQEEEERLLLGITEEEQTYIKVIKNANQTQSSGNKATGQQITLLKKYAPSLSNLIDLWVEGKVTNKEMNKAIQSLNTKALFDDLTSLAKAYKETGEESTEFL